MKPLAYALLALIAALSPAPWWSLLGVVLLVGGIRVLAHPQK